MNWLSYLIPQELVRIQSPINGELKVVENLGKRILYANGDEQSGGTITGMWEKAIKKFSIRVPFGRFQFSNCLLLGLGGGTVIQLLNKYSPEINISVVEIDPVMIDVAEKYFNIKSSARLKIMQKDAFSWITQKRKDKYDLIIYDIYIGKFNPVKATSKDFLIKLKSLLGPTGIILFNRHYQRDEKDYQKFLKVCKKVFSTVELILSYPYSRILQLR